LNAAARLGLFLLKPSAAKRTAECEESRPH
jgi:hypothetical protein